MVDGYIDPEILQLVGILRGVQFSLVFAIQGFYRIISNR
jgi:hypothetical protein